MYIWIDERLGLEELPSAKLAVKPYKPPFTRGGAYIREQDGEKLLTILAGPSPYQYYISPFAQSTPHILNFKLLVEMSTQPQALQDCFLQL